MTAPVTDADLLRRIHTVAVAIAAAACASAPNGVIGEGVVCCVFGCTPSPTISLELDGEIVSAHAGDPDLTPLLAAITERGLAQLSAPARGVATHLLTSGRTLLSLVVPLAQDRLSVHGIVSARDDLSLQTEIFALMATDPPPSTVH
jgi:hypothetical protein